MEIKKYNLIIYILTALIIIMNCGQVWADRSIRVNLKARESIDAPIDREVELYGASYALVIGIDKYTMGWPRLSNAVKDSRVIAAVLKDNGFDVTLKEDMKSEELKKTLEEFFILKGSNPKARLFVWFAGHGHTMNGEGFLIPADAPLPEEGALFRLKALPLRRFGEFMRLAESKHAYAVFDSCFSGTIFTMQRTKPPVAITRVTTLPVRQFLSSGDADQKVSDDGRFRKLFIRCLKGEEKADANSDGYLTASELGMFLTDRLTNLTNERQTPRYGKLMDENYDRGDFVFVLPAEDSDGEDDEEDESLNEFLNSTAKWRHLQDKRTEYYRKVKELDSDEYIESKVKVEAWERLLQKISSDNPFSQEDDAMRSYAQTRISYWKSVKPGPREIDQDGHFIAYDNGTVLDTKTGLMWASKDNGVDIDWHDAKRYCDRYTGGGYTDWRLPTMDELESLYDKSKGYPADCRKSYDVHLTGLIHLSCCCPWPSETSDSPANFYDGTRITFYMTGYYDSFRVLPVRGGK